jgi:Poly(ADP-ribose) polymerase catalytic domain
MIEVFGDRQRRIFRKDFHVPSNWIHQSEDVVRCRLNVSDDEYSKVLSQFNETMAGRYREIQIDRIQNQRWYTAYKAFRRYSKQKELEQCLFHGCPETSAEMIIHSCFNRSFAGVNGKSNKLLHR